MSNLHNTVEHLTKKMHYMFSQLFQLILTLHRNLCHLPFLYLPRLYAARFRTSCPPSQPITMTLPTFKDFLSSAIVEWKMLGAVSMFLLT